MKFSGFPLVCTQSNYLVVTENFDSSFPHSTIWNISRGWLLLLRALPSGESMNSAYAKKTGDDFLHFTYSAKNIKVSG